MLRILYIFLNKKNLFFHEIIQLLGKRGVCTTWFILVSHQNCCFNASSNHQIEHHVFSRISISDAVSLRKKHRTVQTPCGFQVL